MSKYYLRIEGVNFSSFVLDTSKIKAIRGGSLMLLNSVKWLTDQVSKPANDLDAITAGASWGLFAFEANTDAEAGRVAGKVRNLFNQDDRYRHATMTVEVLPAGAENEYSVIRSRLETLSRWSQMQSPSVAIPSVLGKLAHGVCAVDKVRPATSTISVRRDEGYEKWDVSDSCKARWIEDVRENRPDSANRDDTVIDKQGFYKEKTKLDDLKFTEDLHELAEGGDGYGNIDRKMAVIYLDGNHFGKKARDFCITEAKQREFDQRLREKYQNGALTSLLNELKDDADWKNGDRIRLETLLWGGDEIIWVVPAWKGWWMLGKFFKIANPTDWKIDDDPLTHGAGLVFCHYDAPIRPIDRLVRELGDLAKGDRTSNRVAYQILESFDHTGTDLEQVREKRWPGASVDKGAMILNGNTMLQAEKVMQKIKKLGLPKRQLYRITETAFQDKEKAEAIADKLKSEFGQLKEDIKTLEGCFGAGLAAWLHMLELWDYVGLEKPGEEP